MCEVVRSFQRRCQDTQKKLDCRFAADAEVGQVEAEGSSTLAEEEEEEDEAEALVEEDPMDPEEDCHAEDLYLDPPSPNAECSTMALVDPWFSGTTQVAAKFDGRL